MACFKSGIGEITPVVPDKHFNTETIEVKTNLHANLAVDQEGYLRFWWNEPRYSEPLKYRDKN